MKTFRATIYLLLAISFLISCRSIARQETKNTEIKQEIITEKKTEYKDTILYAPKSETSLKVPISAVFEKDFNNELKDLENDIKTPFKPKVYSQKNGNAKAKLIIEKDTIMVEAECDSLALKAQIRQDFEKQYQNYTSEKSEEKKQKSNSEWVDIMLLLALMGVSFCGGLLAGVRIR